MTWYNEKTNMDMALSFQHQEGANLLWYLVVTIPYQILKGKLSLTIKLEKMLL